MDKGGNSDEEGDDTDQLESGSGGGLEEGDGDDILEREESDTDHGS